MVTDAMVPVIAAALFGPFAAELVRSIAANMHDVVAQKSRVSQSSGGGAAAMHHMSGDGSQFGQVWTSPSGMEFVSIPAGTFVMGSAEYGDATPHQVTISRPFYLGKYQVTQLEWTMVMGNNPSDYKGDNRPVENVSWNDCQKFVRKLNAREGVNNYRLPTEAEWEYACRAGSRTKFCFGDGDHILQQYAWFADNSGKETHPVGQLNPNDWGLYDMHGNVWEWCHDWYGRNYYAESPDNNPRGPRKGSDRVVRGGSWRLGAEYCSAAYRAWSHPGDRLDVLGFRLLRSIRPG